ncbi:hypothetical protein V6N12_026883 [Hibiscus sabdariffa]|uniref:Uncharacterized protein n=1 Tax=Hibiscus sabdariffa TaxID=183260 RepID=A0ABR2DTG0_9ROSI
MFSFTAPSSASSNPYKQTIMGGCTIVQDRSGKPRFPLAARCSLALCVKRATWQPTVPSWEKLFCNLSSGRARLVRKLLFSHGIKPPDFKVITDRIIGDGGIQGGGRGQTLHMTNRQSDTVECGELLSLGQLNHDESLGFIP